MYIVQKLVLRTKCVLGLRLSANRAIARYERINGNVWLCWMAFLLPAELHAVEKLMEAGNQPFSAWALHCNTNQDCDAVAHVLSRWKSETHRVHFGAHHA